MKRMRFSAFPVIGLLAMATIALAQEVKTDYDQHDVNFSQYRTY